MAAQQERIFDRIEMNIRGVLAGPFWPQNRIKNDKRAEGRISIEVSGRTIFDKKCFP